MRSAAGSLVLALCISGAFAQDALVLGRIQHSSGIPAAGASVSLINDATGVRRASYSNAEGYYAIPGAESGVYNMTVRMAGFQTTSRTGIKLDVGQAARIDFTIEINTVKETVSVEGGRTLVATEDASVATVVGRDFFENLPLNGRGLLALLETAPGVLITPAGAMAGEAGQFSVNGQRASSNRILVDGIAVDSGPGYVLNTDPGAIGVTPALSAIGSMHNLVSTEALEEFRLQTAGSGTDAGRATGGQLMLSTRSGTNQIHGVLFEFLRNDKLNANDWFANRSGLPRAALRANDFGGTAGGPLKRNRSFFFLSYEGLRLDEPSTQTTTVPSLYARMSATPRAAIFLNSFPKPNGSSPGREVGAYTANVPGLAGVDSAALRLDHTLGSRAHLFGRFSHAPSGQRSPGLTNSSAIGLADDSLTTGIGTGLGTLSNDFRFNISRFRANVVSAARLPPGAPPRDLSLFVPVPMASDSGYAIAVLDSGLSWGQTFAMYRRQWQETVADRLLISHGSHQITLGGDYRHLHAGFQQNPLAVAASYSDLSAIESGDIAQLTVTRSTPVAATVRNGSLFVTDRWQASGAITLTAGLRWELAPAPAAAGGPALLTLTGWSDPTHLAFALPGSPLWKTSYRDIAPRVGAAIKLNREGTFVLRASAGLFYDAGLALSLNNLTALPPHSSTTMFTAVSAFDPASRFAVENGLPAQAALGYVGDFRLPRSAQWNVALERAFGERMAATVTYLGAGDWALIRSEYGPVQSVLSQQVQFAERIDNGGHSSYEGLQAQLRRRLPGGLQGILSYSWAHSLDNVSKDAALRATVPGLDLRANRGNSDFDARQSFSAVFTLSPHWFHQWTLSGTASARTGFPVDVESYLLFRGVLAYASYQLTLRPDYTGAPVWLADRSAGGGRRLNPAAFRPAAQPAGDAREGSLGRNSIAGFGMYQADLAVSRAFRPREGLRLEWRAEVFNISNHPNFGNPVCCNSLLVLPILGQSLRMLNDALGSGGPADGLSPVFQVGGPRAVQLGLRARF